MPQNYNRYGYCLNNPLIYTDPSGEIILGLLRGLGDAIFSGGLEFWNWDQDYTHKAWTEADPTKSGTAGNNSYRIWNGYFTGPDFFGQLPQNTLGMLTGHTANIFGNIRSVEYFDGATVVQGNNDGLIWGKGGLAMTLGNFIIGDRTIEADPNNPLFQHEFGHVLQSRGMRWGYLTRVAIPSIRSKGDHDYHAIEQDANRRAFIYFNERDPNFQDNASYGAFDREAPNRGWNYYYNPLDLDKSGDGYDIVDYHNPAQREQLNGMWHVRATFWDKAS